MNTIQEPTQLLEDLVPRAWNADAAATWNAEAVLASGSWRERAEAPPGVGKHQGSERADEPVPLEWQPPVSLRQRLTRAVSVPVMAGGAVFVLAVVVAIVFAVLQNRPAVELGQELGDTAGSAESAVGSGSDGGVGAHGTAAAETSPVYIHVVGEVQKPGVVEVAAGTRVAQVIEASGGATDNAVLSAVNLARVVTDGEQLVVPNAEQVAAGNVGATGGLADLSLGGAAVGSGGVQGLINLNTADIAMLETLPRIGPALAARIIEWRQANGGFASIDQLGEVSGVGEKTLEGLRARVTV
jgi:competence protein ComEA